MDNIDIPQNFWQDKRQWNATASCPFCGTEVITVPARDNHDLGAMADAVAVIKQHIPSCPDNPNRTKTDLDKFMEDIGLRD